jgi:hypothetical protein
MRALRIVLIAVVVLVMILISACANAPAPATPAALPVTGSEATSAAPIATEPSQEAVSESDIFENLEDFDPSRFDNPTTIDNQWFPLKPGTQWIYEGVTEEGGLSIPHRVIFTVTDLTKVIASVRTVVIWDQDYSAGVLEETELAFFAQDNDGAVWHLGQYPEVYDEYGKLVEAPAWIAGLKGARAGISMKAEPQLGTPSYSQGWGPAVNWTDRAQVAEIGQQTCIPFGCYENVMVIEEFTREEPDAFQLKYYAPGVGNVRVDWKGLDATRERLELIELVELSPEALAEVRAQALELEQRAYEISKEVYDQTTPLEGK